MSKAIARLGGCVMALLLLSAGCHTGPLSLETTFDQIQVGRSTATEVLAMLPDEGMMHTASAVSVFNSQNWAQEVGIVQFSQTESTVLRTDYVQTRSQQSIIFVHEKIMLLIQTVMPDEILDAPYENDMRRCEAILRHAHEAMIEDAEPFNEDRETESLLSMGRSALGVAIMDLLRGPRQTAKLLDERGFKFTHPTLGNCRLYLTQDPTDVFTIKLTGGAWVDPFMVW